MEAQGDEEPGAANAGEPTVKAEDGADEGEEEQEAEDDEPGEDEFEDDDYLQVSFCFGKSSRRPRKSISAHHELDQY